MFPGTFITIRYFGRVGKSLGRRVIQSTCSMIEVIVCPIVKNRYLLISAPNFCVCCSWDWCTCAVSCCEISEDCWALILCINVILPFPGLSPFLGVRRVQKTMREAGQTVF